MSNHGRGFAATRCEAKRKLELHSPCQAKIGHAGNIDVLQAGRNNRNADPSRDQGKCRYHVRRFLGDAGIEACGTTRSEDIITYPGHDPAWSVYNEGLVGKCL